MNLEIHQSRRLAFLEGGGEMGERIRSHDWTKTPLGAPEHWPQPLRTALRILLTTGHPMYIWWGPELLCFYNDAYRASIGPELHPSSLGRQGRQVWEDIWPIIGPQVDQVMSGGGATWQENALVPILRHGRREDVYWTYSYGPIDDATAANGVGGVLVVCTETTRQVRMAQEREAEVMRLDRMFQQAPGAIAVLSGPNHTFEIANPAYRELGGNRDVKGKTVAEALPEVVGQGFIELLDNVYRTAEPYVGRDVSIALRTDTGDLETRVLDFVYQPLLDPDGSATGIFVQATDVTERTRNEADLRQSESRLRFLDDLASATRSEIDPQAIMGITARLLGEHMRVAVCAYADMEPDQNAFTIRGDWTKSGARTIVGAYRLDDFGETAVRLLTAGHPLVTRDALADLGPDQAALFLALGLQATVCMPLVKDGRLTALMAVHDDKPHDWSAAELALLSETAERSWAHIERVRSEAALRELTANLEFRVAQEIEQRSRAEDALRQSQKLEAIGQLTGGVAHDFNNLLTVMRSSADFLRRPNLPEERRRRYVESIAESADRAAKLTSQLLAFSRRQALKPEVFDVAKRVASNSDMLRTALGSRIDFRIRPPDIECYVEADAAQFETALVNLAVNARDAMANEGTLTIAIACDSKRRMLLSGPPIEFVSISVSDTGHGIPAEHLSRLFEPFFTTKEVGKGTGLGLSQVYGFVKQSGGEVDVTSNQGKGATFVIYLPRVTRPAQVDDRERSRAALVAHGRVLIVEDNAEVGEFACQLLEDLGFQTALATDGASALRLLEQGKEHFDLVFSDVVMPGLSGVELGRRIREQWPELPVLLTTGYSTTLAEDSRHGFPLVRKPYSLEELSRALLGALLQV